MKKPKKVSEKIIIENPFLKILKKDFIDESGNESSFLITAHNKKKSIGTFIIPITNDKKIIYLKEFRYGPEKYIINFPVGILDDNISEINNCKKELLEETGYTSDNIKYIGDSIIENYFRGSIKYYIAYNCIKSGSQQLENGEDIGVYTASFDEFEELILSNEIKSSKTCYIFLLARKKGLF